MDMEVRTVKEVETVKRVKIFRMKLPSCVLHMCHSERSEESRLIWPRARVLAETLLPRLRDQGDTLWVPDAKRLFTGVEETTLFSLIKKLRADG